MTSVLMIGHMPRWRDRRTSALLTGKGCETTWLCPAAGEPLPRDLSLFQAMVVLGGPQYVYNADEADHTYLADEMRAIERWLRTEKPFLGICLGAQLLAATMPALYGTNQQHDPTRSRFGCTSVTVPRRLRHSAGRQERSQGSVRRVQPGELQAQ